MSAAIDRLSASAATAGMSSHWLDQLRQASFRGVAFHVDSIDWTMGQNVVIREYPFQDLPTIFSMGRASEEIKLSAYVIGDDYHLQRDSLISALDGEGLLMHPTAGTIRVCVAGKFTIREAPTAEGGMARFDLTFVRADREIIPVGMYDSGTAVSERVAAVKAAAAAKFAAQWKVTGQPGWIADQLVDRIRSATSGVWAQLSGASKQLGDSIHTIVGNYQVLRDGLTTLVATPAQLADHVATLFELPSELSNAAARRLQAAYQPFFSAAERITKTGFEQSIMPAVGAGLVMFGTGAAALSSDAAARATLKRMSAAGDRLFDTMATAAWLEASTSVDLQHVDEALAMRQALHTQCMRLLSEASTEAATDTVMDTDWHAAVLAMLTAGLADLAARSRTLSRMDSVTPTAWTPVWLLSYQVYGTVDYADEILAANPHIEHPLLVPPGQAVRLVSH